MSKSWRDITLALAGVVLTIRQVDRLAKTGFLDTAQFETAVNALFVRNPESTQDLFKTESAPECDLPSVFEHLENLIINYREPKNADLLKYGLGLLHLQNKLGQNKKMLNTLSTRLEQVESQIAHFGITHENVVSNIAGIYTDTISTMPYRIQVNGEYGYLQQQRVANQIRTLLLCGIRFATLWRQVGGKKWHFLFYKKALANAAHELTLEYKNKI